MEDDARVICPTLAIEYHGRDKFKQHLKEVFEHRWQSKSDREDIAATAGDKSFVHWISRGIDQAMGEEVSMYGLDMLVISDKNRIKDAVMFSQLMPSKRKELLKEE
jgi:lysyl-tRNA synthetase class II